MRALVLSGGASKGSFQVGCLKHLLGDLQIKYDIICGTSVGSINGAYLAMYPHGQEIECINSLEHLWRNLKTSDIYVNWVNLPKPFHYIGYIKALWKPSVYNSRPLIDLITEKYNSEKIKNSGKKLRVAAVSLNTGEYRVFDENYNNLIKAILASSSFPGAFCPIEIENQLWTDGGVREITPLKCAFELGATEIDVIITSPKKTVLDNFSKDFNIIKLGPRIVDIMSEEIMSKDIDQAIEINELIRSGANVPGKKYINIRVFRPENKLVNNSLRFEQDVISMMIDQGYKDAIRIINS